MSCGFRLAGVRAASLAVTTSSKNQSAHLRLPIPLHNDGRGVFASQRDRFLKAPAVFKRYFCVFLKIVGNFVLRSP